MPLPSSRCAFASLAFCRETHPQCTVYRAPSHSLFPSCPLTPRPVCYALGLHTFSRPICNAGSLAGQIVFPAWMDHLLRRESCGLCSTLVVLVRILHSSVFLVRFSSIQPVFSFFYPAILIYVHPKIYQPTILSGLSQITLYICSYSRANLH